MKLWQKLVIISIACIFSMLALNFVLYNCYHWLVINNFVTITVMGIFSLGVIAVTTGLAGFLFIRKD